jgi:hypothetical protein
MNGRANTLNLLGTTLLILFKFAVLALGGAYIRLLWIANQACPWSKVSCGGGAAGGWMAAWFAGPIGVPAILGSIYIIARWFIWPPAPRQISETPISPTRAMVIFGLVLLAIFFAIQWRALISVGVVLLYEAIFW